MVLICGKVVGKPARKFVGKIEEKFPQDGKYGGFTHFGVGFYTFRGVLWKDFPAILHTVWYL